MAEDYFSMKLCFETQNDVYIIEETNSRQFQYRYDHYIYMGFIYGFEDSHIKNIRHFYAKNEEELPPHFGYEDNSFFGEQFSSNRYVLLFPPYGEMQRIGVETDILLGKFTVNDVYHLNYDISSIKVETTGENSVYFVTAMI